MSDTNQPNYKGWMISTAAFGVVAYLGVPAVVSAVGFKSAGITAGSTAASLMSTMATGGVTASGGVVATCQSIGAVGAISKTTAFIMGLVMAPFSSPISSIGTTYSTHAPQAYDLAKSGVNQASHLASNVVSTTKDTYSTHAPQAYELAKSGVNQAGHLASGAASLTKYAYSTFISSK